MERETYFHLAFALAILAGLIWYLMGKHYHNQDRTNDLLRKIAKAQGVPDTELDQSH